MFASLTQNRFRSQFRWYFWVRIADTAIEKSLIVPIEILDFLRKEEFVKFYRPVLPFWDNILYT
jgi:hypothetical protein